MGHVLHECSAPGFAGQVAGLDLIDLPVTGNSQPCDRFLGIGCHFGQLGIGARPQVDRLQLVHDAVEVGNQLDGTRLRRR